MSATQFTVQVRDPEGKDLGPVLVDAARIDERVRPQLLKDAVVKYQAAKRVGTHDTKTRAEICASNKKPWRQKGTGRARAGTRRSPLWRGGGIIFGPHPRDYTLGLPKGKRRLALRSALYSKFRDGEVVVVDGLKVEAPRTKQVAKALRSLGIAGRCLIGTESIDRNLVLSVRNLPGVRVLPVKDFNALEVLMARTVLLTREALASLVKGGAAAREPVPGAGSSEGPGGSAEASGEEVKG